MALSRITDSMMNYSFMSGMNKSLNAQYKLMEQTSDGKLIHRPSDDPVRVIRSLQYRTAIVQNEQYTSNVKDATSWMEITDQAVGDLSDLMSQAKSLVVRATTPNSDTSYEAAATQLDGLINEAVSIANTKIGDRYVFGGSMDQTQPFERVKLADPTGQSNLTVDTVVYYGDDQKISMVTQAGALNTARDGINLTGIDLFGRSTTTGTQYGQATTDVFNQLIRIKEELQKKSTVTATNSLGGKLDVDGGYTGPNTYQDFAVKIDALRVHLNNYAQSNAAGGSLALSWTGDTHTLPTSASQVRVRVDAVGVNIASQTKTGNVAGDLSLEYAGATLPPTVNQVRVQIDAVQAVIGTADKSNALGGDMTTISNAYTGAIPAPKKVEVAVTTNATGQVTGANYRTYDGSTWSVPVTAPVSAPPNAQITLGALGLVTQVADDPENATGNTYTFDLATTGKVLQASYQTSTDNGATWSASGTAAADNSSDPFKFTLGASGYVASIATAATNGYDGRIETTNLAGLATNGQVTQASYQTYDAVTSTWSASQKASADTVAGAGAFILGSSGFKAHITANSANAQAQTYTLGNLVMDASAEASELSYSLDHGNTWIKATAPAVTKSAANSGDLTLGGSYTGLPTYQNIVATAKAWKTTAAFTQSNTGSGALQLAADNTAAVPAVPANFQTRIDTVDTSGKVTALSYSLDGGTTWASGTAQASQGPTVFTLGATGLHATVATNSSNAAGNTYTSAAGGTTVAGDPALISYTTAPAPNTTGSTSASTPVFSMKNADPAVAGFALPDGVSADIEANSNNNLTNTYSFRLPPRFTLQDGVEVSVAPSANNNTKDAYTFHMPQSSGEPDHTTANDDIGPDLDWLADKGMADLEAVHDQILTALVETGTKASMYEMAGNMLSSASTNLNSVLASNEDIDMAKAIIDMKTAENNYKAALSFGSRIMPTSLVDFLK